MFNKMPDDVPSGSTKGVREERREAEAGALQKFIDPILLCRNVMDNAFAISCQMSEFPECLIRNKAALYYRVVVIRAPLQGLCYTVRDVVDWCKTPSTDQHEAM